ncbi:MAG: hypothetical protein WCD47_00755 [Candidatus Sulfotelmatobacter sp.]
MTRQSMTRQSVKRFTLILFVCGVTSLASAQIGMYQQGSVVRMHMGDCVLAHHGFMVAFGGPSSAEPQEFCPEYTLVSSKVVYVIVGKSSKELIPLAETIDFRLQKDQLAVRADDAKHESKFMIKEMVMRSEWDRMQRHMDEQMKTSEDQTAMKTRD